MEITLARALRYKKRILQKIKKFESDIYSENSVLEGQERNSDIRKCLENREIWIKYLVDFKLKLQDATRPIQDLIFELSEAKTEMIFYERMPDTHGKLKNNYDTSIIVYTAEIRKNEIDDKVEGLRNKIDAIQNRIDVHNASTVIQINDPIEV